jgi:hypothetical protein
MNILNAEEAEINILYCTICESAYIETTQELNSDIFYCCNICRDFENANDVEVRVNNFDESKVIDYAN